MARVAWFSLPILGVVVAVLISFVVGTPQSANAGTVTCVGVSSKPKICTARPEVGDTILVTCAVPGEGRCKWEMTVTQVTDTTVTGTASNVDGDACAFIAHSDTPEEGEPLLMTYLTKGLRPAHAGPPTPTLEPTPPTPSGP